MLTKLTVCNFKLFERVELELGDRVVLIGPNNAGKTSALQALALWDLGVKRWNEKRGTATAPEKRPGVTINRRDLLSVPIPAANLLWRRLHTQESSREHGTQKVFMDIIVEGVTNGRAWQCGLEFYYANVESFYCRPLRVPAGGRMMVPEEAAGVRVAYLPPMSGLAARENKEERGTINVLIGEGRTAEVLRNLCYHLHESENGTEKWSALTTRMQSLFGIALLEPTFIKERGEIVLSYKDREGTSLDISASGRGQQQTLLLLAHMTLNPGAILLLDEPDAHLEILRQRQMYHTLASTAAETSSQIIAASHSEVLLNEAADRDIVIAFVGQPHRVDDRGSQVLKALKEIGFEHYVQAEEVGWILYVEGSTDLACLRALASRIDHRAVAALTRPFVHYVGNQPRLAQDHFYALRDAKPDLVGLALYDRLNDSLPDDAYLMQQMWRKRELENYICGRDTLMAFATESGQRPHGELFSTVWKKAMEDSLFEIENALENLGKPSPWGADLKVSDEFLEPLFRKFYAKLELPNLMAKTHFHTLVPYVPIDQLDPEIVEKLDQIVAVAERAIPRRD